MDDVKSGLELIQEKKNKVISYCVTIFVLTILAVFPLYTHDYYFDILTEKYKFYYISALALITAIIIIYAIYGVIRYRYLKKAGVNKKNNIAELLFERFRRGTLTEKYVLMFLLCACISTIFSEYKYESFWGNEGRFSGLFLLLLYGVPLIIIGRYGKCKAWIINIFLASSMLLCLFGITDYFNLNLLGFKNDVVRGEWEVFFSTIGNTNTYTSFIAFVVGASVALFTLASNGGMRIIYYFCMLISFLAMITGLSDNAYLSLGAILGFLPYLSFRKRAGVKTYLIIIATLFTAVFMVALADVLFPEYVLGMDGGARILSESGLLGWIVAASWGMVGIYMFFTRNLELDNGEIVKRRIKNWTYCLAAIGCIIMFVILDANFMGHEQRYSSISSYIVFNDDWGSLRGYVWRTAREAFERFTIGQKLFGYGPDTFGIITTQYGRREMEALYGVIFDNTHNEFLHYLIGTGLLGMTSYIMMIVTLLRRMYKCAKNNPAAAALLFSIIGYVAQSTVNINPPIVTPIFWVMMGLGLAGTNVNRKEAQ